LGKVHLPSSISSQIYDFSSLHLLCFKNVSAEHGKERRADIVMIVRMVVGVKKNSEPLVHKLHHSKTKKG